MTPAQRDARAAYNARMREAGHKPITVLLSPEAQAGLALAVAMHGTAVAAVNAVLGAFPARSTSPPR